MEYLQFRRYYQSKCSLSRIIENVARDVQLGIISILLPQLFTPLYLLFLRYHVREDKEPKGVLKLSELNVAFAPPKVGHMNSMQLTFMKDGSTRHIYVYHEEPEVINNW